MKRYYFAIFTSITLTFLFGGLQTDGQDLRNAKAVEYLKTGSYESFAEAVKVVNRAN